MVSKAQYDALKTKALELNIIRKTYPIGLVEIMDIDFKQKEYLVRMDNIDLTMTQKAWSDMLSLLKITDKLLKGLDASVGPVLKLKLLNTVKSALSTSSKSDTALFIINPAKAQIDRVLKSSITLLNPTSFFDLFENQMNFGNKLELSEMFVNENGTIDLNMMSPSLEFNVGGRPDESFYPGVSMSSNYNSGTIASDYTYRLVCQNGMILPMANTSIKLSSHSDKSMMSFLKSIEKKENTGWKPDWHDARVVKAMHTNASFGESTRCRNLISNTSFIPENIIPMSTTFEEYKRLGVEKLDPEIHKNSPVDMSVWDLVNRMTHFASHAQGAGALNRSYGMKLAGMIFCQPKYGTESMLPTPKFYMNN